jgi:hypothetical protein
LVYGFVLKLMRALTLFQAVVLVAIRRRSAADPAGDRGCEPENYFARASPLWPPETARS